MPSQQILSMAPYLMTKRESQNAPDVVDHLLQQLHTLQSSGRLREARIACEQILGAAPDDPRALSRCAVVHAECNELESATRLMEKAIALDSGNATHYSNLGLMYQRLRRLSQAEDALRRCLSLDPKNAMACITLGNVQREDSRPREALASYQRALQCGPPHAGIYNNIGLACQELGNIDEALEYFRRAIELTPGYAEAYRNLSHLKKFSSFDEEACAMAELRARGALTERQRMLLDFSLGKVCDDIGDYDRAFAHFSEANRIRRVSARYDFAAQVELFRRIREAFPPGVFERLQDAGNSDATPIFIIGMPRSGTTLVEQILASHSAVFGAGELHLMHDLVAAWARPAGSHPRPYPEFVAALTPVECRDMGSRYVTSLRRLDGSANRITDKMPHNFLYAGLIRLVLPKATIIHCRRNAIDTCVSCFNNSFRTGHEYASDLEDLGRYYRLYEDLMTHWRAVIPGGLCEIRYEDLVSDKATATRQLLDFCRLPWEEQCLRHHTADRPVKTLSVSQVRREVYTSSVDRWKRYGDHLAPLLAALGMEDPR